MMTVENSTAIDAIGVDKDSGAAHLTIADHLRWDEAHLAVLQEKLNAYLGFIESGEIYSAYPEAEGRTLVIDVIAKYRPSARALTFLHHADIVAQTYGASVRQRHSGGGYADDVS